MSEQPTQTAYCFCGHVYRTRARVRSVENKLKLVADDPCPACGRTDNLRKISSDPERQTL